jgi:hypothetical protein
MNLDLGKRLMDCTLGEYIAAERTIGIISGWAIALFTVTLAAIGRYFYKRWKKKTAKPEDTPPKTEAEHYRRANAGEHICKDYSPRGGYVCTLKINHENKHEAHNEAGEIVFTWE